MNRARTSGGCASDQNCFPAQNQAFHFDNIEQTSSVSNATTRWSLHDHIGVQGDLLPSLSHDSHPLRGKFDNVRTVYAITLPSLQFDKDDDPGRITVSTVDPSRQGDRSRYLEQLLRVDELRPPQLPR